MDWYLFKSWPHRFGGIAELRIWCRVPFFIGFRIKLGFSAASFWRKQKQRFCVRGTLPDAVTFFSVGGTYLCWGSFWRKQKPGNQSLEQKVLRFANFTGRLKFFFCRGNLPCDEACFCVLGNFVWSKKLPFPLPFPQYSKKVFVNPQK